MSAAKAQGGKSVQQRPSNVSRASSEGRSAATGAELIAVERQRQIEAEDWSLEHDDGHRREQIALAAAVYAIPPALRDGTILRLLWPWETRWFKPRDAEDAKHAGTILETSEWRKGRIRTLTKAGALIAAEIDRLQRRDAEKEAEANAAE